MTQCHKGHSCDSWVLRKRRLGWMYLVVIQLWPLSFNRFSLQGTRVFFFSRLFKSKQTNKQTGRATKDNLAKSVQHRSRTDSSPNQTKLKQRPGRDQRHSTGQEILDEISIADRESCRNFTD